MRYVLWLSFIGILYTYAGYPILIWSLSRLRPRRWTSAPISPSLSIVLPVHNGADRLRDKIAHLLHLDYPGIREIIIVSDGSTDDTANILTATSHPVIHPIVLHEQVGKAAALNAGIEHASGEVLLFVDIRPHVAPGAVAQLISNFADPNVGCVAGQLCLLQNNHDGTTAAIGDFYWRYEEWIRRAESVFNSPVGVYGGFYAVRRSLISRQPDGMILDDMYQPLSVIRQGYRSVLDPLAHVFDSWPKQVSGEFHRKVRTLAGNYQLFALAPWSLSPANRILFQLLSHKVMRLIVPWLLLLLFASSAALSFHSPLYATFTLGQLLLWMLALIGLCGEIPVLHRFSSPASALLVLNAAAVVGLYRFITTRGPLWKIWTGGRPVSSASAPINHRLAER